MGVRRAMEMVLTEANKGEDRILTFGPLIHNKQVMDLLESKGVTATEDTAEFEEGGTLVIRAHGIPPEQRKLLKSAGLRLIDATCPRVARVQSIIRYHTRKGYTAVIVGDRDHPEVIGLVGYGNGQVHVINGPADVSNIPEADRLFIVAQTTQDEQNYQQTIEAIKARFPEALVFDTICDATHNRQEEIKSFVGQVDGVVVVGGHHSGNTRRLVQISKAAGMPTFHVETEKDLDKERLSTMEVIGVTAGASTPNWMIQNVVKEIEAIRSHRETRLGRWSKGLFKTLLLSNVVVALGAFSLSYATAVLLGRKPDLIYPALASLYIYAMYVFNRFLDKGASTYNDPERASFYRRHKPWLILTGVAAIVSALAISYALGGATLFAMAGLSILGIIYSVPIVPLSRRHLWRYSKIKDVPGSRTLSEALAWGVVVVLVPLLGGYRLGLLSALCSFLLVSSMVYVRSGLFDIFQVQGDLIVGVETLPITLGEKRTLLLLKCIILSAAALLVVASIFGLIGPFAFLLLLGFISLTLCLTAYEKRWLYPGTRMEALVEANFYFAGLLALIWHILS